MKTTLLTQKFCLCQSLLLTSALLAGAQTWRPFTNTYYGFSTGVIATDRYPTAARTVDLDGDGDMDVVIAQGNLSSGFVVMLNNGSGFYTMGNHYYTGTACNDICVADFTGDGKLDVAVSNTGQYATGNTVAVFPGNGNGTFNTASTYTVGTAPAGLAAADFNGDGKIDLAVANNGNGTSNSITVLLNNGSGGFTTQWTANTAAAPYKLEAGMMNGDALPDLVVADQNQKLTVLLNTGGGFAATSYNMQPVVWAGDGSQCIQLADIDNDGDKDVLYSGGQTWDGTTGHILLRRNLGNGALDTMETILLPAYTVGTPSMATADLNGDGYSDIVAASADGRNMDGYSVLLNKGDGTFGAPILRPGGQWTGEVLAADADGDGDRDVLTVDNYSMELTMHQNNGSGTFPSPNLIVTGLPGATTKIDAADIDNDGDLDILVSADSRTAIDVPVEVIKNNGNGTFAAPVVITPMFKGGVGAKFRDINGDGLKDIIYATGIQSPPYNFHTALNLGGGNFAPVQTWTLNGCGWNDIDAADIDGDGDLDIMVTEWLGCQNVALSARRIFISKNNGAGTFSSPVIKVINPFPGPIALCDFNEDGKIDLATGQTTSVDIHLNDSLGGFHLPVSYAMSQSQFDLLATDLNADGHVDLASCNYGPNPGDYNITVRLGNGDGTFQAVQQLPGAYSPDLANVSGIAAGDIDGDGDLDLIVGQDASSDMAVYYNNGSGVFTPYVRVGAYYSASAPWIADFNGDGHSDVVMMVNLPPSGYQSAIMLLKGTRTGLLTGGAGLSTCLPASVQIPTGISSSTAGNKTVASIHPNPANETATIDLNVPTHSICSIRMYNAIGQLVQTVAERTLSAGHQTVAFQRDGLPAGVYTLHVSCGNDRTALRLVLE